ncbi:MAG: TolC family protein [Bacteroidota bacterium]
MLNFTKLLLLAGFISWWSPTLQAQENLEMDLDACIQYALDNHINIKNAKLDEYSADGRVKEILASGLPQVNISADLQYFLELPTQILPGSFSPQQDIVFIDGKPYPLTALDPETFQPLPGEPIEAQFGQPWQSTAGASLSQLVFDGTYFLGVKAAKSFVTVSQLDTKRTKEETAFNVTKAYYQALVISERLNQLDANINRLEKLFNETSVLNKEGFVERIDVDRLTINLNNLKLEKDKLERLGKTSLNLLKFQMGMELGNDLVLTDDVNSFTKQPYSEITDRKFDPENRTEFRQLVLGTELQRLQLKSVQVGYYPSLFLFGSYQFNAQRDEFDFFDSNQRWFPISVVGLQLNVPVFDGFRKKAQAQQSKVSIKKMENQQVFLRQSFRLEYENNKTNLQNAYTSLEAYEKNVELAKRVYDVANIKYKEGVGSSLEVNDAESQLKEAESNYLSGLLEYLLYQADYQKSMGDFSQYHEN